MQIKEPTTFNILLLLFFSNPRMPKNKHLSETLRRPMSTLRRKVSQPLWRAASIQKWPRVNYLIDATNNCIANL